MTEMEEDMLVKAAIATTMVRKRSMTVMKVNIVMYNNDDGGIRDVELWKQEAVWKAESVLFSIAGANGRGHGNNTIGMTVMQWQWRKTSILLSRSGGWY